MWITAYWILGSFMIRITNFGNIKTRILLKKETFEDYFVSNSIKLKIQYFSSNIGCSTGSINVKMYTCNLLGPNLYIVCYGFTKLMCRHLFCYKRIPTKYCLIVQEKSSVLWNFHLLFWTFEKMGSFWMPTVGFLLLSCRIQAIERAKLQKI